MPYHSFFIIDLQTGQMPSQLPLTLTVKNLQPVDGDTKSEEIKKTLKKNQ
jgi:hypothetical protein